MKMRAFTLIELLIVISIISVLVSIALPRFKGMLEEANIAKAHSELHALRIAVESYYIHQHPYAYPPTTDTLCRSYLLAATTKPKLIEEVLYDPFGETVTTEYKYACSDNGRYYVIWSVGVDGQSDVAGINDLGILQGTDDDDIFATNGSGFYADQPG
jgi:general secretion pathway protein G